MAYQSIFGSSGGGGGGYQSIFSGSSAGALPRAPMLPPEGSEGNKGLFGLLGNLWEGVVGLGTGLTSLVGAGFHDYGQIVGDILPGEQNLGIINDTDPRSLLTDDILKNMAGFTPTGFHPLDKNSILGDIWNRYSPLLPGGRPAQESYHQMYEKPLSFLLDAAAVAGGATKLAGVAGSAKIAGATGEAGRIAQAAKAGTFADLIEGGNVGARTATAAATRAGLKALGEGDTLIARILPETRDILVGAKGTLAKSAEMYNPLWRFGAAAPARRFGLTQSLEDLKLARSDLYGEFAAMPGAKQPVPDLTQLDRIIKEATEAGMTRIEKPAIADLNLKYRSGRLLARLKSAQFTRRDAATKQAVDTIVRYAKDDPTILERYGVKSQALDVAFSTPDDPALQGLVMNTEGQPLQLYHGTAATFDEFDPERLDANALYGPGVYMTEDPTIASSYAPKGERNMFDLDQLQKDKLAAEIDEWVSGSPEWAGTQDAVGAQNFIETLRRPLAPETQKAATQQALGWFSDKGAPVDDWLRRAGIQTPAPQVRGAFARIRNPMDMDAPMDQGLVERIREHLSQYPAARQDFDSAMDDLVEGEVRAGRDLKNEQIYRALIEGQSEYGIDPGDSALAAQQVLEAMGFDGITHIGGARTGHDPHQVYIAFHPEQIEHGFGPPPPGLTPLEMEQWVNRPGNEALRENQRQVLLPGGMPPRQAQAPAPEPEVPESPLSWSEMSEEQRIAADPVYAEWQRLGPRDESGGGTLAAGETRTRVGKAPDGSPILYDESRVGNAFPARVEGSERPLDYVYRVVDEAEYQEALGRGYLQSKGDMNLSETEGTVASHGPTGGFYFPRDSEGRILKIRVDPTEGWKLGDDGYVKTQAQIPMDRVEDVSRKIRSTSQRPGDPNVRTQDYAYADDLPGEAPSGPAAQPSMPMAASVWYETQGKKFPVWFKQLDEPLMVDTDGSVWRYEGQGQPMTKAANSIEDLKAGKRVEAPAVTREDVTGAPERAAEEVPGDRGAGGVAAAEKAPPVTPTVTRIEPDVLDPEDVRKAGPIGERTEVVTRKLDELAETWEANRDASTTSGWDVDTEIDGVRRLQRGLNEAVRRFSRHNDPSMPDVDGLERLQDELRLQDIENLIDGIKQGGMTPRMVLDRAYRPLRAKYGLEKDFKAADVLKAAEKNLKKAKNQVTKLTKQVEKLKDPKFKGARKVSLTAAKKRVVKAETALAKAQNRAAEGGFTSGPSLEQVDDALHAAGIPQPVYFPHIDATNLKNSDWFTSRMRQGAYKYAKNPHDEQMRLVLLKRGTWSKDPIQVAQRRAARAIREEETFVLWDTLIQKYGIELADKAQLPSGYSLVAPDMLFINFKSRTNLLGKIDHYMTEGGLDGESATAKALAETMQENLDNVAALHEAKNVKMYAVPDVVLKHLDSAAKWSPAFGGKNVRLYMDTPMNVWRGLTLTASPRWVLNNVLGNISFSLMQGTKVADVVRIFGEKFRVLMSNWIRRRTGNPELATLRPNSLAARIEDIPDIEKVGHGYIGTYAEQATAHLGREAESTAVGQAILRAQESKVAGKFHNWGAAVKSLNSTIEDSFREASFLAAAEKGLGVGAIRRTGRSLWDSKTRIEKIMKSGFDDTPNGHARSAAALNEVNHFFGDYGSMSPFERHVIRRWIFPFWGFYKHSSKLLLSFPFEYPGRALLLDHLNSMNEEMMQQYGAMPDWLESAIPLGPPGTQAFLTTRGANPFAGVGEGISGAMSMLAPLPQTIAEQALGRDTFTGREFTDKNVYYPFGSEQGYDINTLQPVDKVAPGIIPALLSSIPQYDMLKDLIAGGNTYDTATYADAIQQALGKTGEASPIDPETGQPFSPATFGAMIAKMAGAPITNYDLEAFQQRLAEDQRAVQLEAQRRMMGATG